jgi:hypothetical protein
MKEHVFVLGAQERKKECVLVFLQIIFLYYFQFIYHVFSLA